MCKTKFSAEHLLLFEDYVLCRSVTGDDGTVWLEQRLVKGTGGGKAIKAQTKQKKKQANHTKCQTLDPLSVAGTWRGGLVRGCF